MRRIARATYHAGVILLFVLIASAGFTQTRTFKNYLRNLILDQAAAALQGDLSIGVIEGNLLTGFTLRDLRLRLGDADVLTADRLDVRYDPIGIPFQRVVLNRAILSHPVIHVWCGLDGRWNIDQLVRPTPADSSSSPWTFDLRNIQFDQARLTFIDSLELMRRVRDSRPVIPPAAVDYARIDLDSVRLNISAQIARGNVYAQINDLAFVSQLPSFRLRSLRADISLTKHAITVGMLRIETPGSRLRMKAALKEVNLATLGSLRTLGTKPLELELGLDRIDTKELKQFLYPWVDFLDGTYGLHLDAAGTLSSLRIENLSVQAGETFLQLNGRLDHLDHPVDLLIDLNGRNRINSKELPTFLPGLQLPDLAFLGDITASLRYTGRPIDFQTQLTADCAAGGFDVEGSLRIEKTGLVYKGTAQLRDADLALVTGTERWKSRLNGRITFDGAGTDPRTMIALARVEVDSSEFAGLAVRRSVVVVDAADASVRAHAQMRAGTTSIDLTGRLTLGNADSLAYGLDGKINSLNLVDVFDRRSLESDLSFTIHAAGERMADVSNDSVSVGFLPSVVGGEPLPENNAEVLLTSRGDDESRLRLRSDFCDLDASGRFTIGSLFSIVDRSVRMSTAMVRSYTSDLDSLRGTSAGPVPLTEVAAKESSLVDVKFHVNAKDMYTLGVLLFEPMEGMLTFDGMIAGRGDSLRFDAEADVKEFAWAFPRDTLFVLATKARLQLAGVPGISRLPSGALRLDGRALALRSAMFVSPAMRMDFWPDSAVFAAATVVDSTVRISGHGTAFLDRRIVRLRFQQLALGMGSYEMESAEPFVLSHGRDGFHVDQVLLTHDAEEATVSGFFDPAGSSQIRFSVQGFLLNHLTDITRGAHDPAPVHQYGGIVQATGEFNGTFEEPEYSLSLQADGVRVRKSVSTAEGIQERDAVLGRVDGRLTYRDRMMDLFLQLRHSPEDTATAPDLLLSGVVPYDLTMGSGTKRPLTGEIDVSLRSQGLNMEFLDPFVPEIVGLTGVMTCDMRMRGSVDAPRYEGGMAIRNARFLFQPVDLRYVLNSDLVAAGDRIELKNTIIRNVPEDKHPDGVMNVIGNFRMLGLRFRDFDLLANGELLVMNSQTRQPGQKFYGQLAVASGPRGLLWQGNLHESTLKGEMLVRSASLTFPPEREAAQIRSGRIVVSFRDDTSRTAPAQGEETVRRSRLKPLAEGSSGSGRSQEIEERSFLDGISYDVALETQGPTQLRLVFNTQTTEELFADLRGRLYFFRTPQVARLTGSVEVSDRSYYNFIKKFTVAEGKLLYTGDPLNPELDLTAKYEGEHRIRDTVNNPLALAKVEKVVVILKITGTRNEPKPKMGLEVDEKKRETGEEESDAISFILSGQFRDELTDQQRTGLIGTNLGFGLASGMLTGPLSDYFRRTTGFIQSVDVLYYGGGTFEQSADFRFTGQIGETVIRWGGRVLNDPANINASVELPLSSLTGNERLRNLIFTLERRVEGVENTDERRRFSNGARLFYRFSF